MKGSATSLRRVRDTRDDVATILRGILSHKIFEYVQNFRDFFAPLGDTCEEIADHWRLFQDCFATHSRCLSPAVAKQSQSSENGALVVSQKIQVSPKSQSCHLKARTVSKKLQLSPRSQSCLEKLQLSPKS